MRAASGLVIAGVALVVAHAGPATSAARLEPGGRRDATVARDVLPTRRVSALPVHFEANCGQTDPRVEYVVRCRGFVGFLHGSEAALAAPSGSGGEAVRMSFAGVGDDGAAHLTPTEPLAGRSHYLRGSDPTKWVRHVPHFAGLVARDVRPGIDLHWRTPEGRALRYDLEVAPGADVAEFAVRFEGAANVHISGAGALVVATEGGEYRHARPVAFQDVNGARRTVSARWERRAPSEYGFVVGSYDAAVPLVIDPTIAYSTYLGGSGADLVAGVAVDAAGRSYLAVTTLSFDYPTTVGAFQTKYGEGRGDAAVTKLDPVTGIVFSTFIGGSDDDDCRAIVIDATGSAYVTGFTRSTDFPTKSPFQNSPGGVFDAYVARVSADGSSLLYSTYLGGSGFDVADDIALGSNGEMIVVGATGSADFPTTPNSPQSTFGGGESDAYLTILDSVGGSLVCSTYVGGTGTERARSVASAGGSTLVTGFSDSTDFPVVNAIQATFGGGLRDGFIAKLNTACTAWDFATYHGGIGQDVTGPIAVDATGRVVVAGITDSLDFPLVAAAQDTFGGQIDVYVSRLNAAGTAWEFSTLFGGNFVDGVADIVVEATGGVHFAGNTTSTDLPVTVDAAQRTNAGLTDGYYATLAADGASFPYVTYFGGDQNEQCAGLAVDSSWTAHLVGETRSDDFPLTGTAIQSTRDALQDGYLLRVSDVEIGVAEPAVLVGPGTLYLTRGAFKIKRAQHAKGKVRDTLVVKGSLNPAGASADPTGTTVSLAVNGGQVIAPITLDAKGRGKSAKNVNPSVRVRFKPSTGQFTALIKNTDLRTPIPVADATASTTEGLRVAVTIANAGLLVDTATSDLDFSTRSKQGKSSRGSYSFKKSTSRTAIYRATRTDVTQRGPSAHKVSLLASLTPDGGGPFVFTGDATVTVGTAAPIVVPLASLDVRGKPGAETVSYSRALGQVTGLKAFTISNRTKTLRLVTDNLVGIGVPASGAGAPTSHDLDITVELQTAAGTTTYGSTVEILRSGPTSGRWRR